MKSIRDFGLSSGYRLFNWPWWKHYLDIRTYWYVARTFCQRGLYGWAERDVWSIDLYLSNVIPEMLDHYLSTSHSMFYEDADESFPKGEWWTEEEGQHMRNALQKRSDVKRVIDAFRADANECVSMMCDHETDREKKRAHAEYWLSERQWSFTWLQEHWSGLWT